MGKVVGFKIERSRPEDDPARLAVVLAEKLNGAAMRDRDEATHKRTARFLRKTIGPYLDVHQKHAPGSVACATVLEPTRSHHNADIVYVVSDCMSVTRRAMEYVAKETRQNGDLNDCELRVEPKQVFNHQTSVYETAQLTLIVERADSAWRRRRSTRSAIRLRRYTMDSIATGALARTMWW